MDKFKKRSQVKNYKNKKSKRVKILFYGAGIIGQIYATKLFKNGIDATLLARGENYLNLKQNGMIIHNVLTNEETKTSVPLTRKLNKEDHYDLIIVTVRLDQLESIKEILKTNQNCRTILFMLNNPKGIQTLNDDFPDKKIILGFPGVGGTRQNGRINYVQIKKQKTTLGDFCGNISGTTKQLKEILEKVNFKVSVEKQMKAWLVIHSVFISSASAAIALENGDSVQLGKNRERISEMVQSIGEGFKACRDLGLPIIPKNLKTIFVTMPKWFSVLYWSKAMRGKTGTLAIAPHANSAKSEMQLLAKQILEIVANSSVKTPTLNKLLTDYINLR